MAKYKVSVSRVRYTDVEVEASNEEEAAVKARMFIDKDGSWNYHWVEDSSLDVCEAHLLKTPEQKKLDKMIDKLCSYGVYVQEQYDAENNLYGYLVTADVNPIDYAVGLDLTLRADTNLDASGFLQMWKTAVREFNPEAFAWNWLSTLSKDEARESVRNALEYFDGFKTYLRQSVHGMMMYMNTLEHEED